MRTVVRVVLSFFAGLIVAYIAAVGVMFWYMSTNTILDRDGGMSMAIMFAIGPLAGLLAGTIAAIAIPIWLARRELPPIPAAPLPPKVRRRPPKQRATIAAVCWGIGAFALAWAAIRIGRPAFSTYEMALAVGMSPYAFGLIAAALGAFLVLRGAGRETV